MMDRFGVPIKYAILALLGGVIWLFVGPMLGIATSLSPIVLLISVTVGGFVAGLIRQRKK